MRNVPIPVDTSKLQFTCVKAPRPKLVNKETGEIKTDKAGQAMYEVTLSVEDDFDRIELVKVAITGEPAISQGEEVIPIGLMAYVWEIAGRWGVSLRADSFIRAGGKTGA